MARRDKKLLPIVGLVVLLSDQASKWLILYEIMAIPRVIEVLPFFNIVLVFNTGVSFGVLGGDGAWQPMTLSLLALVICSGLLVWQWRQGGKMGDLAIAMIVGGALGNVIDRLRLGGVVDFLDFHLSDWHWPAFNLADSAITVGVAILLCREFLFSKRESGKKDGILEKREK